MRVYDLQNQYVSSLFWLFLSSIIIFHTSIEGALITQSYIDDCSLNDDTEPTSGSGELCKKKYFVSMTLKGGQVTFF